MRERGYESVMFRPYQPRERLSDSLSAPDVHLISLKPNLEGLIVPSKYYGIAAAGRPAIFVGNPDGELARIIRDSNTGFVIRDGDGVGLAEAILKLARNPELAAEQGARARRLFESKYDFAHAVTAWESLIRKTSAPFEREKAKRRCSRYGVISRSGEFRVYEQPTCRSHFGAKHAGGVPNNQTECSHCEDCS